MQSSDEGAKINVKYVNLSKDGVKNKNCLELDLHVSEVSPRLPSAVGVVDEDGAVGDGAVPRDLQAVDVAQVDGEVDEEASLEI